MLSGTIFHGTKIGLRTWIAIVEDLVSPRGAVSAAETAHRHGLTHEAARRALNLLAAAGLPGAMGTTSGDARNDGSGSDQER